MVAPPLATMLRYQSAPSPKAMGIANPPGTRIPTTGVVYTRPERLPRWRKRTYRGTYLLPAIRVTKRFRTGVKSPKILPATGRSDFVALGVSIVLAIGWTSPAALDTGAVPFNHLIDGKARGTCTSGLRPPRRTRLR